ncbi:TPA: hypothetical protein ACTXXA_001218 [Legionella anisa]
MASGKQREYFHKKTQESLDELRQVSTIFKFHAPFFKQPLSIVAPKLDKVDSLDTCLSNVSNIFKTLLYTTEVNAFSLFKDHEQFSQYFPVFGFCIDVLASIIYKIAELMPKNEQEIEMHTMGCNS